LGDLLAVGDDDQGELVLKAEIVEESEYHVLACTIEVAGRLVCEPETRLVGQGAGDRDSPAFARGELSGPMATAVLQPDFRDELLGTSGSLARRE
jgi:hypothetical protein